MINGHGRVSDPGCLALLAMSGRGPGSGRGPRPGLRAAGAGAARTSAPRWSGCSATPSPWRSSSCSRPSTAASAASSSLVKSSAGSTTRARATPACCSGGPTGGARLNLPLAFTRNWPLPWQMILRALIVAEPSTSAIGRMVDATLVDRVQRFQNVVHVYDGYRLTSFLLAAVICVCSAALCTSCGTGARATGQSRSLRRSSPRGGRGSRT
jgi:hypothetical protein